MEKKPEDDPEQCQQEGCDDNEETSLLSSDKFTTEKSISEKSTSDKTTSAESQSEKMIDTGDDENDRDIWRNRTLFQDLTQSWLNSFVAFSATTD